MKHKLKWLLGGALAVSLAAGAVAQTQLFNNAPNGNEVAVFAQGGPGGPSIFVPLSQIRNATGMHVFASVSGTPTYTALTTDSVLYWVGTAPTSWTITTPAAPYDGMILQIASDTTLTSMVTLTANTGQSLNSSFTSQTITGKTSVEFVYSASTTKWYQMR